MLGDIAGVINHKPTGSRMVEVLHLLARPWQSGSSWVEAPKRKKILLLQERKKKKKPKHYRDNIIIFLIITTWSPFLKFFFSRRPRPINGLPSFSRRLLGGPLPPRQLWFQPVRSSKKTRHCCTILLGFSPREWWRYEKMHLIFSYGGIPTKWNTHCRVFFMWSFTSGSEPKLTWWFEIRVKFVPFFFSLSCWGLAKVWWINWTQQPCWKRIEREEEVYQKGKRKRRSKTKEKEKTSPKIKGCFPLS